MSAREPGICLTFDDLFVENWCAAREVFLEWNAKVTFCVSHLHTATEQQVRGLHDLQDDGHEIAFHSRTHPRLAPYLERHGLDVWLQNEIDEGVAEHRALGFPADSFACPFHKYTVEMLPELSRRFHVVRASGPGRYYPARVTKRILPNPIEDPVVHNIGFCDMQFSGFPGWDNQCLILDEIAAAGGVGVFAGHDIRKHRMGPGLYSAHRQIRRLLKSAKDRGLAFYTLRDLCA